MVSLLHWLGGMIYGKSICQSIMQYITTVSILIFAHAMYMKYPGARDYVAVIAWCTDIHVIVPVVSMDLLGVHK